MSEYIVKFRRLAPEAVDTLRMRYAVLDGIAALAPVGRRALSEHVGLSERIVRAEADRLRELALVGYGSSGMTLTEEGSELLDELRVIFEHAFTDPLVQRLTRELGIPHVMVIPGDSATDGGSAKALSLQAARHLNRTLRGGNTVAVMGGATMAGAARMARMARAFADVVVIPARGALGEDLELQANTVAAALAGSLGAHYRLLHWPDDMTADMLPPSMRARFDEWLESVRGADILMYGIGRADKMVERRGMERADFLALRHRGAVAEALGYYYDRRGSIVHQASALGVDIESLQKIPVRIAVAGGADKAEAILAVSRGFPPTALIIDEAAAGAVCVLLDSRE